MPSAPRPHRWNQLRGSSKRKQGPERPFTTQIRPLRPWSLKALKPQKAETPNPSLVSSRSPQVPTASPRLQLLGVICPLGSRLEQIPAYLLPRTLNLGALDTILPPSPSHIALKALSRKLQNRGIGRSEPAKCARSP